jgi:hypothetical protein
MIHLQGIRQYGFQAPCHLFRPFFSSRDTVACFKSAAQGMGIAYQTSINPYLRDCAVNQRTPHLAGHPKNEGAGSPV